MRSQNTDQTGESSNQPPKKGIKTLFKHDFSESTDTATPPSLHSLTSQWWAQEAHEGFIVRNDENVRDIMRSAGLSFDEAVVDDEGKVTQQEGVLLTNVKKAVEILKEQGGVKSEHWVV